MRKEIEILIADGCTKNEAERHLERGAVIYELGDFIKNKEEYLYSFDEEEKKDFMNLVDSGTAPEDWGLVEYEGCKYLIQYCL